MGTPGDYGIVIGGAFYGVHQRSDGYPQSMGSRLAAEAADISDREWRSIGAKVQKMLWVVPEDAEAVAASGGRLASPSHPDGDFEGHSHNFEYLVPRLSRAQTENRIESLLAARPGGAPTTAPSQLAVARVLTAPSFRGLAEMGTATKTRAPWSGQRSPYAAVANLDQRRFVIFDGRGAGGSVLGDVYASVPLSDRDALSAMSARLTMAIASLEPPTMPPMWRSTDAAPLRITDGMVRRPPGYPQLPDAPAARIPAGVNNLPGSVNSEQPLCNAPLRDQPGKRCRNPRPKFVGGKCQANHVRTH